MWKSKTQTTAAVKRVQREFSHNFSLLTLPAFNSSFAMVTEARGKPKFLNMQGNKTEIQNHSIKQLILLPVGFCVGLSHSRQPAWLAGANMP